MTDESGCVLCGGPVPTNTPHDCTWALRCGAPLPGRPSWYAQVWWAKEHRCSMGPKYADGRCFHHSSDPAVVARRADRRPPTPPPPRPVLGPFPVLPDEIELMTVRTFRSMVIAAAAVSAIATNPPTPSTSRST